MANQSSTARGERSAPTRDALSSYLSAAIEAVDGAASLTELADAESSLLGKRSAIARWKSALGPLSVEERKNLGEALNDTRRRVEAMIADRRAVLSEAERVRTLEADRLDLTEVLSEPGPGHLHLVSQVREQLEDVFLGMGYEIAEGPEVETDWYNFTALNIDRDHPARSAHDTFFVDLGEPESILLRTHTSPVQIHLLERGQLPIYAVAPGRVYRPDTPDATHLPFFNQIEGLVVDSGVTFADMSGTIDTFVEAIFGDTVRARLRPGYFPFTEPSGEFDISCAICDGAGCRSCTGVGWLELGGCGMVHPAVLEATGLDPEIWTGFAFGFGIDRIAMNRHDIEDLRSLVENDIRFLTQF
ncbi:MAG TPA: phenylalanine--tRNA ligase subunit alpha [Acidimicrobiales bacterium]|nr:phenylalanine--tRNA ligase subunit alpha [Acidimicrobiales bacterium]